MNRPDASKPSPACGSCRYWRIPPANDDGTLPPSLCDLIESLTAPEHHCAGYEFYYPRLTKEDLDKLRIRH